MLAPFTKKMRDDSGCGVFRFTFFCDICEKPWMSEPIRSQDKACGADRLMDHNNAYERANKEAMRYFNRCPVCKRWVCDDCFLILPLRDVCMVCARQIDTAESGD
jgi:hypothetical protein